MDIKNTDKYNTLLSITHNLVCLSFSNLFTCHKTFCIPQPDQSASDIIIFYLFLEVFSSTVLSIIVETHTLCFKINCTCLSLLLACFFIYLLTLCLHVSFINPFNPQQFCIALHFKDNQPSVFNAPNIQLTLPYILF